MNRLGLILSFLLSVSATAAVADEPDPVRKKLDTALASYAKKQETLDEAVAQAFEKRESAARAKGDKAQIDQLKWDRQAFAQRGDLPPWVSLEHVRQRLAARAAAREALDAAVREYSKKFQDARAEAVEKERAAFDAKKCVLMCFEHEVHGSDGNVDRSVIKLLSNMTIDHSKPVIDSTKSQWSLNKDELDLRWVFANPAGARERDKAKMSRDGNTYSGANVKGQPTVRGTRRSQPRD